MKLKVLFVFLTAAMCSPLTQAATCTRADLTGTWRLYTLFDSVSRCTMTMPGTGSAVSTNSNCYFPGVTTTTLKGSLAMSSDCHVTGTLYIGESKRTIDGWISKGKDSVAGIAWQPDDVYTGDVFSGVKQ